MSKKTTNVLIVEDDKDLREAYAMIIESAGYSVRTAENGKAALANIDAYGHPTIMFLDLRMPEMDGLAFLERYGDAKPDTTTIVVFSNFDAAKEIDAAYKLGADRYILKARAAPKELIRIVTSIAG